MKGWGAGASQQYSRMDKMRRKHCHPAGTCCAMCQGPRLGRHDASYYPARRRYSQSARAAVLLPPSTSYHTHHLPAPRTPRHPQPAARAGRTSSNKLGTSGVFSVKSSQAPRTLRALSRPHPPIPLIPTPRPMQPRPALSPASRRPRAVLHTLNGMAENS